MKEKRNNISMNIDIGSVLPSKLIDILSTTLIDTYRLAITTIFGRYNIYVYRTDGLMNDYVIDTLNDFLFSYHFDSIFNEYFRFNHHEYAEYIIKLINPDCISNHANNLDIIRGDCDIRSRNLIYDKPDNLSLTFHLACLKSFDSNSIVFIVNNFEYLDYEIVRRYYDYYHRKYIEAKITWTTTGKSRALINDTIELLNTPRTIVNINNDKSHGLVFARGLLQQDTISKNCRVYVDTDKDFKYPYNKLYGIKDILFRDNKMIVFWEEGDKTIITHCKDTDPEFDLEKAIYAAITKRTLTLFGRNSHERSMKELVDKAEQFYEKDKKRVKEIEKEKVARAKKKAKKKSLIKDGK